MAEIFPIRRKSLSNQSISLNRLRNFYFKGRWRALQSRRPHSACSTDSFLIKWVIGRGLPNRPIVYKLHLLDIYRHWKFVVMGRKCFHFLSIISLIIIHVCISALCAFFLVNWKYMYYEIWQFPLSCLVTYVVFFYFY